MKYLSISLITLILLAGCASNKTPAVKKQVTTTDQNIRKVRKSPPPPKKEIELKKVEDTNYNDAYMYPQAPVQKEKIEQPAPTVVAVATESTMGKQACIAMISQEKFDKYTSMFGSEAASIKRCNMIKAMNQ